MKAALAELKVHVKNYFLRTKNYNYDNTVVSDSTVCVCYSQSLPALLFALSDH